MRQTRRQTLNRRKKSARLATTVTLVSVALAMSAIVGCGKQTQNPAMEAETVTKLVKRSDASHPSTKPPIIYGQRKFPYPYDAMLAISSDADHETLRKLNLVHEFLNTTAMTSMGKGLGLDISDSFFMYNASNLPKVVDYGKQPISHELSWFQGTSNQPYGASVLSYYIQHGWIDTIHTFGDFSMQNQNQTLFSRKLAEQALNALASNGDYVTVWTDHGNKSNVDNFGSYGTRSFFNYQQGANPTSRYHHTDLTIRYGIQFVWTDEISSQYGHTSMIYPLQLPDGHWVWGFWRFTSNRVKHHYEWTWGSNQLANQLSYAHLYSLIRNHQYAILAQHLSSQNSVEPLPTNAIQQLRVLANLQAQGKILVARTSRLLTYNVSQMYVQYHVTQDGTRTYIHITGVKDPMFGFQPPTLDKLRGITFYTSDPSRTDIDFGNTPITPSFVQRNASDGRHPSIGIAWFPADTTNYAQTTPGIW